MSFSKVAFSTVAIMLMGAPALAAPVAAPPGEEAFSVGKFQLFALRDMFNVLPNDGKIFGKDAGPEKVEAFLKEAGAPTDKITLSVDALLVKTPESVVLIDTGLGPKVGGVLMQSLAQTGVSADAVTDILITHGHGDHIGGLLTADGKPAFPKAAIHMSAAEWTWIQSLPADKPYVDALGSAVKTFEPGGTVIPGFRSIAIAGHTPGHTGYEITSGDAKLLDIGDTAHSSLISLGHPEWVNGYDGDASVGEASREKELAALAASGEQIFAPHFPFPGIGTIVKSGTAYAWKPAASQKP